jgi:hypothetical protein
MMQQMEFYPGSTWFKYQAVSGYLDRFVMFELFPVGYPNNRNNRPSLPPVHSVMLAKSHSELINMSTFEFTFLITRELIY